MSRSVAREVACQMVFEYLFLNKTNQQTFSFLCDENKLMKADRDFAESLVSGVVSNFEMLEETIKGTVKDFSFSQIIKMDHAILLVALFEIICLKQDAPLATNEAVKIAKKFSTDKSSSFINGVISSFVRGN